MTESSTSERRLAAIDKQHQALELRKAGVSFPKIAERLGYKGPSGAYDAVHSAIRRVLQEPVEELVKLELARLDDMYFALSPAMKRGDEKAIARGLAVLERRAKYLGLDAPKRINIEGMIRDIATENGADPEAAVREAQRIIRSASE